MDSLFFIPDSVKPTKVEESAITISDTLSMRLDNPAQPRPEQGPQTVRGRSCFPWAEVKENELAKWFKAYNQFKKARSFLGFRSDPECSASLARFASTRADPPRGPSDADTSTRTEKIRRSSAVLRGRAPVAVLDALSIRTDEQAGIWQEQRERGYLPNPPDDVIAASTGGWTKTWVKSGRSPIA
ncbi:hypothetical protein NL676_023790 [Syzygium grande]|nr:hypothetical protein NL676_023790 [Syzygium grande]